MQFLELVIYDKSKETIFSVKRQDKKRQRDKREKWENLHNVLGVQKENNNKQNIHLPY